MKKLLIAAALAAASVACVEAPALAQASAYAPGNYWSVQGIHIEPGQFENYMDYIADKYRKNQEFAKSQGWISGYRILVNVNKRADEPDLYLISEFARMPDAKEQMARDAAIEKNLRETTRQAEQGSGQRVSMRRLGSSELLQELTLK
jgi:opacity protein-like surface antigen